MACCTPQPLQRCSQQVGVRVSCSSVSTLHDPSHRRTTPASDDIRPVPRIELTVTRQAGAPYERTVVIDSSVVRIGSHPSNDLVLDDPLVSKFHCRLLRGDRRWRLEDAGSLNGTYLSGIPVRDADLVFPECRIELGRSDVRVRELGSGTTEELAQGLTCGALVGRSAAMRRVFYQIRQVAKTDVSVLIEGETGTGKELVAAEIVQCSSRKDKPLVVVDCGAIPTSLIESELFGHVRGAFTGADRARTGAFEAADGGTVFLDEIGELPLEMQPKLLRVLAEREVHRMGDNTVRRVDVRVIAATNRTLEQQVNLGQFREDLYFRLAVVTLRLPPLRERTDDIPLLVDHFLGAMGAMGRRSLFSPDVLAAMCAQPWPGNVRELRNFIERRTVIGSALDGSHEALRTERVAPAVDIKVPFNAAKDSLIASFERQYLRALLDWAEGNVSKAARKAGLDRMYVHRLLQRHGIERLAGDDSTAGASTHPSRA